MQFLESHPPVNVMSKNLSCDFNEINRFGTLCISLCLLLILVFLPALSRIQGNLQQKTILQTIEQLIRFSYLFI